MSDLETRDDNGQFATAEPLTGQAGLEHDAGWKPLLKEQTSDEIDEHQGAEELAARRDEESEPIPITLVDSEALDRGEIKPLDDPDGGIKTSLTPEWAASELTTYREGLMQIDQETADAELLAEVGVEPDVNESAKPDALQATSESPGVSTEADEIGKALNNPAVVEALQGEFNRANEARETYVAQLDGALAVARQVTFALVPELRGVTDASHAASVLAAIQQQNPQRFAQIQQLDRDTGQLMAAAHNERQAAAQREMQAVHAYNAEQERAYETKWGKVDRATGESVRSYLEGLGATNDDIAALAQTRLPAWAQRALIDGAEMHRVRNAPKAVVKPDLPPVQRPGVARAPGEARQTDLTRLNGRLSQSGSVDDAFALVSAMRANRR
ncbi:hypothetical protein M2226_008930 [Bradyrhizobium elkanii]|uniref:hypothetical protein n=1 Tax=Bradyrhizobium elkanii TaxID=29448 RepID=UPI002227862C|nr:hypothetical protein [Bradyrhizobium elkanii]MCW2130186.1 hypothetical protein [Bradyrhizobium elkanii]MCW2167863.1 hypothetical protein [Bradyrhizobium elkanii]